MRYQLRCTALTTAAFALTAALAVSGSIPAIASPGTEQQVTQPTLEVETAAEDLAAELDALSIPEPEAAAPEMLTGPMPGPAPLLGDVVVAAAAPTTTGGTKRFGDIRKGDRFYSSIMWMYSAGLTTGVKSGSGVNYMPRSTLSRAAMAAFLYREAGSPEFTMPKRGFIDVPKDHQFYKPIMWMKANKLTTGVKTKHGLAYKPGSPLSREAMAAFLYRNAGSPKVSGVAFPDVPKKHKFYRAITWMEQSKLTTGVKQPDGTVKYLPQHKLSREAMAAFMHRQAGKPAFIDSGTLALTGVAAVDSTLTAKPRGWQPSQLDFKYQWLANGANIAGATSASYTPVAADQGKKLSVRVAAALPGQKAVSMTAGTVTVAEKKATQAEIEERVFELINQERTALGLHALAKSNLYQSRIRDWTQHLLDTETYEHAPYDWYAEGGRRTMGLGGETLALSALSTLSAADDLVNAWKGSPAHWAILMSPEIASGAAGVSFSYYSDDPDNAVGVVGGFILSLYFDENETGDPYPFVK